MTNNNNLLPGSENKLNSHLIHPDIPVVDRPVEKKKNENTENDLTGNEVESEATREGETVASETVAKVEYLDSKHVSSSQLEENNKDVLAAEEKVEEVEVHNKYDQLTQNNLGQINNQQAAEANELAVRVKNRQEVIEKS